MTRTGCESNVVLRSAVGKPGTFFLDRVKKAFSARSLELKYANLSVRVQNSGEKQLTVLTSQNNEGVNIILAIRVAEWSVSRTRSRTDCFKQTLTDGGVTYVIFQ